MKEERMEKYLELFASSNDFGGQVLDQLKLIRKFMSLKSLNPELNLILWDCLKILEYSLRALEWNKDIEIIDRKLSTIQNGEDN